MIAVHSGNSGPCPFVIRGGGMGSHPSHWELGEAEEYIEANPEAAIYYVRGCFMKQILPKSGKWTKTAGVRIRL